LHIVHGNALTNIKVGMKWKLQFLPCCDLGYVPPVKRLLEQEKM